MKNVLVCAVLASSVFFGFGCSSSVPQEGIHEVRTSDIEDAVRGNAAPTLMVGGVPLEIEFARTPEEKARGLSGRNFLAEGKGMLFPYTEPLVPVFWMKGMNFSIDIIWIRDMKVVDISRDLPLPEDQHDTELPRFSPQELVTEVLEVPAGWSEKYGIIIGSPVSWVD